MSTQNPVTIKGWKEVILGAGLLKHEQFPEALTATPDRQATCYVTWRGSPSGTRPQTPSSALFAALVRRSSALNPIGQRSVQWFSFHLQPPDIQSDGGSRQLAAVPLVPLGVQWTRAPPLQEQDIPMYARTERVRSYIVAACRIYK